ncbi:hypothetical protein FB45DRAFT_1124464 [Roridomyces roridus]|uniref:Uncharacterized protein n=1 Tax=Roridomyces roridus TaxID=1738132 RepID=A0AAD7C6T8_9AGAR|nr:hypothetical protein FB45DRAFT_1124464 [Roridomyces roridus]
MELEEMSYSARKASPPWLITTGLALPQFLEEHYDEVLQELIFHPDMAELPVSERNARISSMGRALFEFLWIQYELGDSYNLGVDLLHGIQDRSVVSHGRNSDEVAEEMFSASPSTHVKALKSSHILRDRPTIYRRRTGSQVVKQADSIPVTIDPEARSNIFRFTRANGRRAAAEALGDANGDGSMKKQHKSAAALRLSAAALRLSAAASVVHLPI